MGRSRYQGLLYRENKSELLSKLIFKVHFNHLLVKTLPAGFTEEDICLDDINDFDLINDRIELRNSDSDGVSFELFIRY